MIYKNYRTIRRIVGVKKNMEETLGSSIFFTLI